jgi:excisionase family DNA binding protein
MCRYVGKFNTGFLSKAQACEYLNISRSTFDKMIKEGKIPKGKKR